MKTKMCNGPLYVDSFSAFQLLRNYNRLVTPTGLGAELYFIFFFLPVTFSASISCHIKVKTADVILTIPRKVSVGPYQY